MKEKVKYILYIIAFIVIIILLNIGYRFLYNSLEQDENKNQQTSQTRPLSYLKAADFTVYDADNNPVQLSSFKGKPIVINFWTTWCSYCDIEMPYFNNLYEQEKENVTFLMLNVTVEDEEEKVKQYISSQQLTIPVYYDKDGLAAQAYNITGYPVTVFINKDFNIYQIYQGAITQEKLQQYINEIK